MGSKLLYLVAILAAALVVFAVVNQMDRGPNPVHEGPVSEPEPDTAPDVVPPPLADTEEEFAATERAGEAELVVRVVSESGEPMAGATVTTAVNGVPAARRRERTDVEGTARFVGLPGGKRVSVQASAGLTDVPTTATAELSDDAPAEVRLVLRQGGAVSGTVFGAGGAPIQTDFTVTLERTTVRSSGVRIRNVRGPGASGKKVPAGTGTFSFSGVEPGTYTVAATAEGHTRAESEPFEVKQGAITDGVQVFLETGGRISGVVVRAATGEPIAGATVSAGTGGGFLRGRAITIGERSGSVRMAGQHFDKTDEQGRFEIDGLEPGDYQLTATAKDHSEGIIEVVTVDKGRETGGLRIEMGEGGTLTGTVYGPDGRPVPGAEVLVSRVIANMRVFGNMGGGVKANERGVYLVEHLTPGRYSVRRAQATSGSSMAVSIVMSGGNNPAEQEEKPEAADEVTVREGQVSRKDLRSDLACGIRGIASNEANEPIRTRIDVSLLKSAAEDAADPASLLRMEIPRFTNSNEKGEFEFTGLEPGTWKIAAPGFSKEVELVQGRTEEVMVRVRPSGIEGVVLGGDGKPMAGVRVRAESTGGRGMANVFAAMGSMKTDEDGRFSLKDLSPGKYRVRASGADGEGRSEEIDLGSGEIRRNIRVVIERKVAVTVTVRDAAGEPVAGVWVFLRSDGGSAGAGQTDAEGVAKLAALPGSYRLTAMRRGTAPQPVEREVLIRPGSPESFELTLE